MKHYYLIPVNNKYATNQLTVYATDYQTSTHQTRIVSATVPNLHDAFRAVDANNTYRNHIVHIISARTKWGINRQKQQLFRMRECPEMQVVHA
ncbi:hypothetical protein [Ligilactobacillus sp. LYQ60]|uniref:hypothetical protein n=1 Tax=unclassified Ligilactobacillus TaxID=2767920 RepID=UPI003851BE3D